MNLRNTEGERICEVCRQPLPRQWSRCDRATCSPKCRQQAYRNRLFQEREARYRAGRQAQHQLQQIRDKRNAARRKARKAAKRKGSSKP